VTFGPSYWWWRFTHWPAIHRLAAPVYHKAKTTPTDVRNTVTGYLRRRLKKENNGPISALLRKQVWSMNRSYQSKLSLESSKQEGLTGILSHIANGEIVEASELLPYLCLESRQQRSEVNAMLADAFIQGKSPDHLQRAKVFIQRAWTLSGGSADLLPLYSQIYAALNDTASIREAYKQMGMKAATENNISSAINYFTLAHNAFAIFDQLDRFEYDFDVLSRMNELAAPHRLHTTNQTAYRSSDKIRVAHLIKGITESNSILVEIDLIFARFYDRSAFDVTFFIPDSKDVVERSAQAKHHLKQFESLGFKVMSVPSQTNQAETLLALAKTIYEFSPHVLLTSAALADYRHYFITSLRPAPICIGLVQGPPAQFAPPILDWCIAWTKHPLMDCPVDCSWVEIKIDYPMERFSGAHSRKSLGLPEDCLVLLSAGRPTKFQSQEFWQAIGEILKDYPDVFYLAVGPREDEVPFLSSILGDDVRSRIRCLGWREDFLQILPASDILIDTYPNGGGQVIVQAMSLGIPFVAHANDYMSLFDQTNWSPVEDFISESEIIVSRGDFQQFKKVLSRLIEDKSYRSTMGELCRAEHVRRADPEKAVRGCEEVFRRVIHLYSSQNGSD
jgi:glycosyltransferase involved in cell wall biosynthesis